MKKLFLLCLITGSILTSCKRDSGTDPLPNPPNKPTTATIPTLTPTVFAGNKASGSVDGTGSNAKFYQILKLTSDKAGNIYVLEAVKSGSYYFKIRKITPNGVVTTLFNGGLVTFVNNEPTEKKKVFTVIDIAADPNGTIYAVANPTDYSIPRKPNESYYQQFGTYKLIADSLSVVSVTATTTSKSLTEWVTSYNLLDNIAVDANGKIFGAFSPGNLTGIPSLGKVYQITPNPSLLNVNADAIYPNSLIGDASGVLYASTKTDILKITASGASSVFKFPTSASIERPRLVGTQSGTLYAYGDLFDTANKYKGIGFYKINTDGAITSKGIIANPGNLFGVTTDASGNIYYALHLSTGGYVIYKVKLS